MPSILNKCVLGGNIFTFLDKKESHNLISKSLELGIKSIDTSDTYGNGLSEKYIGNILRTIPRQELKIYTKAGTTFITESNGLYTKKNLIRKINESLKRLNTDYIDIYQLHNFDNYTPPNEIFETLEQLKLEGKILNYGVSNYNEKNLLELQKLDLLKHIYSNQVHYNLVNRHNLNLSKFSKLIVYGALARGLFRDNPEDSFRVFKSKKINDDKNSDIFKSIFAPSPKYAIDIFLEFFKFKCKAIPTANEILLPTIAEVPIKPFFRSIKCIEPPYPFEHPVFFPYNSAIIAFKSPPLLK